MKRIEEGLAGGSPLTTVLDHVRPTVVVRRRIYEVPRTLAETSAPSAAHEERTLPGPEDDESGPPSSMNVARALASLRADELNRLEAILRADGDETDEGHDEDEDEDDLDDENDVDDLAGPRSEAPPAHAAPAPPGHDEAPLARIRLAPAVALTELARRISVPAEDLVTALVTRGYFAVTVKSVLPRETARAAAAMFGWSAEDDHALGAGGAGGASAAASADHRKKRSTVKATTKKNAKAKKRQRAASSPSSAASSSARAATRAKTSPRATRRRKAG